MITSNINEILLKNEIKESEKISKSNDFLNSLISTSQTTDAQNKDIQRNDSLTYENIKGITLEEINTIFKDEESKQMAKNLRLATLFTQDDTLGQALFNTVLGEPFDLGYSYLYDRYEDKNSFLNTSSTNSLADLLHSTISNKINNDNKKTTDVISQDRLDEILTSVNSFSFVDALSTTTKDEYGRYKDKEDDDYSFLYNDYALQYEQLKFKYEELTNINKNLIKQF
ncbi:hypothetical protein KO488_09115 [Poseidonibacter lekithochrous]|uniref:hypothetical protein n=1 Tax=Poseidonibacter TaxID=2321187 RepID=UPI001C09EAE7|nr:MULTISPECIES: hypothetical protein [Poseidonibacter]MBU3014913.1 hypothetical protein [Poseidonibacter lekithochrous]MDO6828211.1 hypothetical protein [Poseidonibacter sp. 1_MG-2023]